MVNFNLNFSFLNFGKSHQYNKISPKDDSNNLGDEVINNQIDEYRENTKSSTKESLKKLQKIEQDNFDNIQDKTKYRLLVNIAVAYEQQNKKTEVAEYLITARQYSESCDSFYGAIYGYLIQKNKKTAETLYKNLKATNPQSNYVFMSEILLNDFNNIDLLEKNLPKNKLNEQDIVRLLAVCYHQNKKDREALIWSKKCYELGNKEPEIQSLYAFSLLNCVIQDEMIRFGGQWSENDKNKLDLSIELFLDLWEQYDSKKIKKLHLSDGINLCNALQLKGNIEKAEKIAKELFDIDNTHIKICSCCAIFFAKQRKYDKAIKVLNAIFGKDNKTDCQLIELLSIDAQHKKVIEKIDTVDIESLDTLNQEYLNIFKATAIYNTQGKDSAYQFIDECNFSTWDNQLNLLVFYNYVAKDQKKSSYQLQLIEDLIKDNATNGMAYRNKMHLAEIYYERQDDKKAINLYKQLITIYRPSKILVDLLTLLFKVDDRLSIKKILDNFDKNSKTSELYINTSINFYLLTGELEKVLTSLNKSIQKHPENLNIRLLWINTSIRMWRDDEVKNYLKTKPKFSKASPEETMKLAQFFNRYEFCKYAIKLGYETLRNNWRNENCHTTYVGLIAMKDKTTIPDADVIGINTTFSIVNDFSESKTYTIVDSPDTSFNEIDLDHYIAQEAINKKTGDTFVTNNMQKKTWSIKEVVSKYVGLLRKSTSEFNEIFPNSKSMYSVKVREGKVFEDIKPFIDHRDDDANNVCDFYQKQPIPVSSLAECVVELWQYLLSNKAVKVNVSTPSDQSKEPIKNNNGYIVDAITLYLMLTLGVHHDIKGYLGNIAIVQVTLDLFLQLKKNTFEPQMIISRQDGKYYRQDVSTEDVQNSNIFYQDLYDWTTENCTIIPADGNLANEHEGFEKLFDLSTRETLIAAKSSDRTLLTDDRNLRWLADKSFGINGIFSKDILYWNEATEDSKYYGYLHQLRLMNCIYLPLELGELWHWIYNCKIINNKFIPSDEVWEIKKYKDNLLNITNFDTNHSKYMQYSITAIINVVIHMLISGDTHKQVRVDWIMDNLYFDDGVISLNERQIKERELSSFLISEALLYYAESPSVNNEYCIGWIEEKFIQPNKSSDLIEDVANRINDFIYVAIKNLPTSKQTNLYIDNFINQLPIAIKNEVEKILNFKN